MPPPKALADSVPFLASLLSCLLAFLPSCLLRVSLCVVPLGFGCKCGCAASPRGPAAKGILGVALD
eukprot:scaffold7071_cov260-Pinguiococcus_pyrenoidosus.AAC.13